jgi:hypothetical protein
LLHVYHCFSLGTARKARQHPQAFEKPLLHYATSSPIAHAHPQHCFQNGSLFRVEDLILFLTHWLKQPGQREAQSTTAGFQGQQPRG